MPQRSKEGTFIVIATIITAIGSLLFGYDTGVISGAILFIKVQFSLSPAEEGFVVSAVLIGALVGAITGGPFTDRLGRKKVIIYSGVLFIIGALVPAIAVNVPMLVSGRIIAGLGVGTASFASPLYIAEVSPPKARGKLVSVSQLLITIGIVVSYLTDFVLAPSANWRAMFALAVIPGFALALGMFFMPESPRWLVAKTRINEAINVLKEIRDSGVDKEVEQIEKELAEEKKSWKELFSPVVKTALIIGVLLAIFQQVTGINTVIYYAPTILQLAGFSSASVSILGTVGIGIVNVIMTVIALSLIDKLGRRPLLIASLSGMTVTLFLLGYFFLIGSKSLSTVALLSLIGYVAFFAIGLGPVFWLLISEIFPLSVRGIASSFAAFVNWTANFVVALTFPDLIINIGKTYTFWVYGIVSIIAIIFIIRYVPETKGLSLEQIQALLAKKFRSDS
ncbi:sugar porter family MFS transporter [Metallosphaera hakonensis JCM 8857 = DSM 7519]|uniref:MFS transporter n=2 Tax=Metallosphaera hakonensis TaxID=79601 RepID=A0A2U9IWQ2_9CREN|nr:sugar porter family MFS transporter [Metallosphaera hakonensis JCM 8857 = DSM 7519]